MIDIRSNFFYTRTVPCQLWFFDRAKEHDEERSNQVLMVDARNICRKVSGSVFDFSPEQQKNIAAIIWLYRGQSERFLSLVEDYLAHALIEGREAVELLWTFGELLGKVIDLVGPFAIAGHNSDPMTETWEGLTSAQTTLSADIQAFASEVAARIEEWEQSENGLTRNNATLHAARDGLHDMAERCRDLSQKVDTTEKLATRVMEVAVRELDARKSTLWANAEVNRARRALEEGRATSVETLRRTRYFVLHSDWLQERFPDAQMRDVEG